MKTITTALLLLLTLSVTYAKYFHVDGKAYKEIGDVPWGSLQAGDNVYIHWRSQPYKTKWVIDNVKGTAAQPIRITGISSTTGEQPVIDGNGATTPTNMNFYNEDRGLLTIGTYDVPEYITIENLELRAAHLSYQFKNIKGNTQNYLRNAAAIYVAKGKHIVLKNNTIHDSSNGIFVSPNKGQTQDIRIVGNYLYGNGNVGSPYEHNTYTSAIGMIYEGNHFGALRKGAKGNNLKDRSAGLIVRYNWIENGNRQLDLVDATGADSIVKHPSYRNTYVYGNVLLEEDGQGNAQIVHYGGDSGKTDKYRQGTLHFYNNTVVSSRSDNTTLLRLSTNDELTHIFNNVYYGKSLAILADKGIVNLQYNWITDGWKFSHSSDPEGILNDLGNNVSTRPIGFVDAQAQDWHPVKTSPLVNAGLSIPDTLRPVEQQYQTHQQIIPRNNAGTIDIGAFEWLEGTTVVGQRFTDSFE